MQNWHFFLMTFFWLFVPTTWVAISLGERKQRPSGETELARTGSAPWHFCTVNKGMPTCTWFYLKLVWHVSQSERTVVKSQRSWDFCGRTCGLWCSLMWRPSQEGQGCPQRAALKKQRHSDLKQKERWSVFTDVTRPWVTPKVGRQ